MISNKEGGNNANSKADRNGFSSYDSNAGSGSGSSGGSKDDATQVPLRNCIVCGPMGRNGCLPGLHKVAL